MKAPKPGDKVVHILQVTSEIVEVLDVDNFTNHAKVRDNKNRILLIHQRKRGDASFEVITELDPSE